TLSSIAPLAWSTYRFDRKDGIIEVRQTVGPAAGKPVSDVGWTGKELVAFRMHLPSRIQFHNARDLETRQAAGIHGGNILAWEQAVKERLRGAPLEAQVRMDQDSILARTLLLFGTTIVAALATFAAVIWWISRRGRETEMAESRP